MSLSVLVDQTVRWDGEGAKRKRVLVPPAPETLKTIRDLVAGVAGLTPDRGDQLIVETLPFELTLHPEAETGFSERIAPPATAARPLPRWLEVLRDPKIGGAAVGGAVLAVVAVLVFLVLRRRKGKARTSTPAALAAAEVGATLEEQMQAQFADQAKLEQRLEQEALSSIKLPKVTTKKTEVLVKQVKEAAKKDASVGAHVLRAWIGEQMPNKNSY